MIRTHLAPLPHWVISDNHPAFYDTESLSAVKMVARLYSKIEELICNYNTYARRLSNYLEDFENGIIKDFKCFKECITNLQNEYIKTIDIKIDMQDSKINDAINYMKDNIIETASILFEQALKAGKIKASLLEEYDNINESLILSIGANLEEEENNNG